MDHHDDVIMDQHHDVSKDKFVWFTQAEYCAWLSKEFEIPEWEALEKWDALRETVTDAHKSYDKFTAALKILVKVDSE